ncbi:MAG: transglycosylase SLT domain-containing protein [Chloroflexota bacterium]|nr:transglycosylase SLT domain-containing protein [Chloroflexota bacterium]
MEEGADTPVRGRSGIKSLGIVVSLVALVAAVIVLWMHRDTVRSPQALYRGAQTARPARAEQLYETLARKLPEIEEYGRLWAAEARMPSIDAVRDLRAVIDFRPQSPAAYRAYVVLARYYAALEAPQAEEAYRAALEVHAPVSLRLELARYLEECGDDAASYAEYRTMLGERPDAFAGMRRMGPDSLTVAEDLNAAYYFSDALEVLRNVDDSAALPVRARALKGLGRNEEAREACEAWLEESPDDEAAMLALAEVLEALGETDEALALYQEVDSPDSRQAQAGLLEDRAPDEALDVYLESPYTAAWWTATALLESQGRLTETLPVYARIARTDTYLADDAAYRLTVLGRRLGDEEARAEGEALLSGLDLNWLALRATDGELRLPTAPLTGGGEQVLAKAEALESIGRQDLARLELLFAAQAQSAPEVDLAMAQALALRGHVTDAQPIAEGYVQEHARAPGAFWELSYPQPYSATVAAAAAEFDVDPLLIWSIMRQESRFDPRAFGYVAERGLMQILPTTQDWIAEQLGEEISPGQAFTPEANVRMGAWYLRHLLDYYDGDLELAIPAYNAGPGNVDAWRNDPLVSDQADFIRWIGFGQTREYLEHVALNYRVYQVLYGERGSD